MRPYRGRRTDRRSCRRTRERAVWQFDARTKSITLCGKTGTRTIPPATSGAAPLLSIRMAKAGRRYAARGLPCVAFAR